MKKKNLATLMGIALVVAVASTGVFYGLFVSKLKSNVETGTTIVVAARAMPAGTVLTAADLKTAPWASPQPPAGAFERVPQVAGQTLFDGVKQGEPLLEERLASLEGGGRSAGIPAGMRAVSVHVSDSSGVIALLRAGHRVDVQVLLRRANAPEQAQLRTAIENLEVLAVEPKYDQSSQGYNLPVVTLLATSEQSDILAVADSGARLRLILRNPLDGAAQPHPAVSVTSIMQARGATVTTAKSAVQAPVQAAVQIGEGR